VLRLTISIHVLLLIVTIIIVQTLNYSYKWSPFIEKLISNKNCLLYFFTDHVIIYRSSEAWLWVKETTEHYEGKSLPSIRVRCSCRQDKPWIAQIACNLKWQVKVRCLDLLYSEKKLVIALSTGWKMLVFSGRILKHLGFQLSSLLLQVCTFFSPSLYTISTTLNPRNGTVVACLH